MDNRDVQHRRRAPSRTRHEHGYVHSRSKTHWLALLVACALDGACVNEARDIHAARTEQPRHHSGIVTDSQGLCSLIGPNNHNPGVWGSDLGISARAQHDTRLTLLFGDTWASPVDECQYPPMSDNDMQGTLPVQRPASLRPGLDPERAHQHAQTCDFLEYARERPDDATSWRRVRLFASPNATSSLDMSGLRTPLANFSDGERMLGIFQRGETLDCGIDADCPDAMRCTRDPSYRGVPLGECTRLFKLTDDPPSEFCRDDHDCIPGASCHPSTRGACLVNEPFAIDTARGRVAPEWYRGDPRRGLATSLYVAAAIWPDRPADYATLARFPTQRFQNITARSVAFFDPEHPESNDYRAGYHTLLVWGRSSFVESDQAQALPFLLYVPLSELRASPAVWRPRFFAGYDASGKPAWSERESEAKPIYGGDAQPSERAGGGLEWSEPEIGAVAQMTLSWVEPLSRWVMLYGGDVPAFLVMDPRTGDTHDPVHLQFAPGAIHMRVASHPWGADRTNALADDPGWSSAEPLLTREVAAPYLACPASGPNAVPGCEPVSTTPHAFSLIGSLARHLTADHFIDLAKRCIGGEVARTVQERLSGDPIGRLYAPNIIEEWTEDVTDSATRERGERAVELYWNVSTWNPYQVVLFKSRLTQRIDVAEHASNRFPPR